MFFFLFLYFSIILLIREKGIIERFFKKLEKLLKNISYKKNILIHRGNLYLAGGGYRISERGGGSG